MELSKYRKIINSRQADYRAASVLLSQAQERAAELNRECVHTEMAQEVAREVAQRIQQQAHERVADVVTAALRQIFGDDSYQFTIDFQQKRGRTEAQLQLHQGGLLIEDPISSVGGGVVDVIAFALRVAAMKWSRPAPRPALILDEPFKWLSAEYRPAAAALLQRLAEEMQIVLVTHIRDFEIGRVEDLEDF